MAEGLFISTPSYAKKRSELLKEFGFDKEEEREVTMFGEDIGKTGYPAPKKYFRLSYEVYDLSLEEPYYWILEDMQQKFPIIEKLEDSFAAAENSAFFGVTQQRLGAQQDKVSQFLATVGKMIKELFQMVRELRIIDERIEYYIEVEKQLGRPLDQRGKSAEITLKGFFVDLVQGGGKSAASVYGMSRELEFITLPDLFFDAPPFRDGGEMEKFVEGLSKDFNRNVIRVLERHLRQFMEWKKRTHQEHMSRRRFMLAYLRQHFEIIKMYINWLKPYLRHTVKLTLKERNMDSPEMVSAFEGSMLDIELLARKRTEVGKTGGNGCILITINYRTRPELKVVQEGYQRGPVHIGRFELNLRVYAWTDEQVERYKKMKERESLLLMGEVSSSVQAAMESLGAELDVYLEEARGEAEKAQKEKEEGKKADKKSVAERFFGDFYTKRPKEEKSGATLKKEKAEVEEARKAAEDYMGYTKFMAWLLYKNFKKAHAMVMW
ncbi:MAG: hypothetical protein AABX37_04110 [Nanoarchaeota archaeon]